MQIHKSDAGCMIPIQGRLLSVVMLNFAKKILKISRTQEKTSGKNERISAHRNFGKDSHVIYPEIDDTMETDIDNLQGHDPVEETEKPKPIR